MSSDDTVIDNMKTRCENPTKLRSCLVTKYAQKVILFALGAMCLPLPPYVAFKYYLEMRQFAVQCSNPRQNRMMHQDAPAVHLQKTVFSLSGGGFLICVRRIDKIRAKEESNPGLK